MLDFETVARYYKAKVWSTAMVAKAVVKGVITAEQYKEITGEDYVVA